MTTDMAFETVWDAIEDTPESAAIMRLRSDLMIAVEQTVDSWGLSQARAAKRLGVSQPRLNDLLRGRIGKFSLDALVGLAARAGLRLRLEVGCPSAVPATGDAAAGGYKALAKIAVKVKNGIEVAPVAVRDLLRMFGAKYRGVRTNRLIRQALLENGIHIDPDINAHGLDDFIVFRAGWKIDETERLFYDNYRELHLGSILTEIEAAMLNKLYLERFCDSLAGWIDRNPAVSESEVRARAASLNEFEFDDLEREEGAEIITFPETRSGTNVLLPINDVATHVASNTSISEADSQVLRSYYEQRRKIIG